MISRLISLLVLLLFVANARASVRCNDVKAVAKEGIEYSLLGAWLPFTDHACFKGKHFHYFHPELGIAEGNVTDWSKFRWFDKNRDTYSILSVTSAGDKYRIAVRFTIKGKTFTTSYDYAPDAKYAKSTGICGYITNPEIQVVRIDCTNKAVTGPHIN